MVQNANEVADVTNKTKTQSNQCHFFYLMNAKYCSFVFSMDFFEDEAEVSDRSSGSGSDVGSGSDSESGVRKKKAKKKEKKKKKVVVSDDEEDDDEEEIGIKSHI